MEPNVRHILARFRLQGFSADMQQHLFPSQGDIVRFLSNGKSGGAGMKHRIIEVAGAVGSHLRKLPPSGNIALLSTFLTVLAIAAAELASEATFRLFSDVDLAHVRLAIMVTAALVAIPIVTALVWTIIRTREEKKQLASRSKLLSAAQGYAKQGDWELDVVTQVFVLSDALHNLLGDVDKKLQLTIPALLEMTNTEDRDKVAAALARILTKGSEEQIEYRLTGLDGNERTFWVTGAPLLGPDGTPVKVYGIGQDITRQKALEAALRDSEDFYRHAVELSPHMPWTADAQGNLLDGPPQWQALTGLAPEACLESGWARALHPQDVEAALQAWEEPLRTGEPYYTEHRVRLADGSYRWFRARASARRDETGRVIRWYGTVEDIHERKIAEIALTESEAFAGSILESTTNCIRVLDLAGHVQYMNPPGLRALEIDDFSSFRGQRWSELWPEETRPVLEEAVAAAKAGAVGRFTAFCPTAKGKPKWWDTSVSPILGQYGGPIRLLAASRDVTDQKLAQDDLDQARKSAEVSAQRLSGVLESTTDCVFIMDTEWRLQFVNQRAKDLFQRDDLQIGRSVWDQFPEIKGTAFGRRVRKAFDDQKVVSFEEYLPPFDIWLEVHAYPSIEGISFFFRNVTLKRRAQQDLVHAAQHDPLTGLLNRSCFREHLEQQLERTTADSQMAVLFLDLDEFKSVNDALGHPAGDQLLKETGVRLKACLRSTDQIARFGGDEFAILQAGVKGTAQTESLAQRIIKCFERPFLSDEREIVVGTSVGIVVASTPGTNADDMLKRADIALYQAKADGRGIYRFFEPGLDIVAKDLQRLRQDLRDAVKRREFRVHYQPVIEFETARVIGFEALVRWQHPWRGLLQPADFISLAESTGVIEELGAWVLEESCSMAATWPKEISLSVNLSPRQFRGRCLMKAVSKALSRSGLAADRLQLEITESVLLQDDEVARRTLESLRDLGVRISIDDFGTGYSSLGYLQRFSVDNIKIDRSFVVGLLDNERTSAILRALVSLGEDLGVSLTAEGIETVEHFQRLKIMGCRQGQGYLFARPMPPARVAAFLSEGWDDFLDQEETSLTVLAG